MCNKCNKEQRMLEAWLADWPSYCRTCNAQGGEEIQQSFFNPVDFVHCNCVENNYCPRCDRPEAFQEKFHDMPEGPCVHCGWNWGDGENDFMPQIVCEDLYR